MKKHSYFNILPGLALLFALILPACAGNALEMQAKAQKNVETMSFTLPVSGKASVFTLDNPHRLVVDVPNFSGNRKLELPASYRGVVRNIRVGQHNAHTVRIVFELADAVSNVSSKLQQNQLTIRFSTSGAIAESAPAINAGEDEKTEKKAARAKPKAVKSAKQAKAHSEKPTIVIDAGHGGQDPGAQGPNGALEKDITLEFAKALKAELLSTRRYKVKLTREGDYFILLRERTAIARRAKGDLFISIHADSAPGMDARGLSVYTLSENASDKEAEALAVSENRADILSGLDLSHESEDVANILISLAQRETNNTSAMFADFLVHSTRAKGIHVLNNPHRFAGFAVLKSPDMPSVLIECGFISSPEEEKQLQSRQYRTDMVKSIVMGIDSFFKKKREGIL